MANKLVQDLIDAGVHFGHRASRWNPKMAPYILSLIHISEPTRPLYISYAVFCL